MRNRTWCGALLSAAAAVLAVAVSAPSVEAQTPYIPYFGKNQVRYDHFKWHTYETEHFIIYFYPEIRPHLERMAGYAESAYQAISADLKHDLAEKVPLILFQTSSEFQEQNVIPGAAQEGVGAFAEPIRKRIVMPMDEPPDLLYRLIVHELTHQFEFDIIPTSLMRRSVPLWVNEGLSDYMTGIWRPQDLMTVRDAAITDAVPKMSELNEYGNFGNPRMIYNLGHAVFEFIESRWGKEGLRQYLFALRKSVIGGGENAYQEAFKIEAEDFDQQFDRYLKERFKPFRDKERPADYGRNLAPNAEKTAFSNALSAEPSPSGDLMAVVTGNRKDSEADIVLVSTKDGAVIRNLTKGFDQKYGFDFIVTPGGRWNTVPWMTWAPTGDRLAYFVRREKSRTLVLQNVLNREIEARYDMRTVDDPESPDISPDGKKVVFAALQDGTSDLFLLDLESREVTNITKDAFADAGPTWSPDGKYIVYMARISGNEKLFRLDVDTGTKTQITFGTHDDASAQFLNADTLVFPSTATNPSQPLDPDVAKNGEIFNIWTLNLKNGELRQFTDTIGGNTSAVVMPRGSQDPQVAFIGYYKGAWELHALEKRDPIITAASSDFGAPGPIIDFQAPLAHTLVADKIKQKGKFEKMFVDGRPPVALGVTSGGDLFGGTAVTFSDVLGDQQFNLFIASVSQYRTFSMSYLNLERRLNYALQGYSQTQFFYGQMGGVFYDPAYAGVIDRDLAIATQTIRGGSGFAIWPFNRYRRLELSAGIQQYSQNFNDPSLDELSDEYQQEQFGQPLLQNGTFVPFGVHYVQETTVFREFGPLSGNTVRAGYEVAPKIGDTLSRQTVDADARFYQRIGGTGLLALRARMFKSWGQAPGFIYFGGNSELRGYDYLSFLGSNAAFFNAELRFPLIHAMLTPVGVMGGIRGVLFAGMGGGWFEGQPFSWWKNNSELYTPIIGYRQTSLITQEPIYGPPTQVDGLRLVDARGSYGIGLETFALGFPIHIDWSWKTLFNRDWEDLKFAAFGGSSEFRKPQVTFWMGYDF
jgi:hypothetical protein